MFSTNLLRKIGIDRSRLRLMSFASIIGLSLLLCLQKSKALKHVTSFSPVYESPTRPYLTKSDAGVNIDWTNRSFPRWDSNVGIPIAPLIEYTHGSLRETIEGHHRPTAVYVIDGNWTLWTSERIMRQHTRLTKRIRPSERLALQSLKLLRRSVNHNKTHPWIELENAIRNGGFLFLAYHKDFNGCNHKNWRTNMTKYSIPIFTLCARLDCAFAFPWPTYESISLAKGSVEDWLKYMSTNEETFAHKKPQAIWRGSLTGTNNKNLDESIRWQLCKLSQNNSDILDARLVEIPKWRSDANLTEVGGLAPLLNMENFQRYVAVVDVDGNAWSSRFAALLCMDSVVLKVQPTMVDFFHYQLEPWTHYIPINADLTDLVPKIEWVLSHPSKARRIVENAHHWCSRQMITDSLAKDLLTIWNSYVQNLDTSSSNWSEIWKKEMPGLFHAKNKMTEVEAFFKSQGNAV